MIEKIVVPDIGENIVSGKVVAVHIKAGDWVAVDGTVIELETDKAVVEIPSPLEGRVVEVLAREGDELKVGDTIASVETEARQDAEFEPAEEDRDTRGDAPAVTAGPPAASEEEPVAEPTGQDVRQPGPPEIDQAAAAPATPDLPVPASPAIRRMARELGVPIQAVAGSGPGGRITEADIKAFVRGERRPAPVAGDLTPGAGSEPPMPDFSRWGAVESVALETVRRLTARSTAASWRIIPHVTQFDKADVTLLETFLERHAKTAAAAGGKLTLTPVVTRICAEALKKFPRFNTSLDLARQNLIFKKYVHIGIAVDTPRGLLMPVIRNADQKSITALAKEIADLADRARNKKISAAELEGGTFSISNQGGIGGVGFTPIILWPQAAILGMSRAAVEPVAVEGEFVARTMLPLCLSYDHRVIDGADAARFLRWICDGLEQPLTMYL